VTFVGRGRGAPGAGPKCLNCKGFRSPRWFPPGFRPRAPPPFASPPPVPFPSRAAPRPRPLPRPVRPDPAAPVPSRPVRRAAPCGPVGGP